MLRVTGERKINNQPNPIIPAKPPVLAFAIERFSITPDENTPLNHRSIQPFPVFSEESIPPDFSGFAKVDYIDGGVYIGQLQNCQRHGQGTMVAPLGTVYKGGFQNNKPHGQAIIIDSQNQIYRGDIFKDGPGIFIDAQGRIYNGEFQNFLAHGRGIAISREGEFYKGEFEKGEFIH